jgi:hypothetical protein
MECNKSQAFSGGEMIFMTRTGGKREEKIGENRSGFRHLKRTNFHDDSNIFRVLVMHCALKSAPVTPILQRLFVGCMVVVTEHMFVRVKRVGVIMPATAIMTPLSVLPVGFAWLIGHQPCLIDSILFK